MADEQIDREKDAGDDRKESGSFNTAGTASHGEEDMRSWDEWMYRFLNNAALRVVLSDSTAVRAFCNSWNSKGGTGWMDASLIVITWARARLHTTPSTTFQSIYFAVAERLEEFTTLDTDAICFMQLRSCSISVTE